MRLWGNYSINESWVTLTETEQGSTSSLKYSLSKDGNTLILYYENGINFDTLTREN
jgi:filamentous hemagglutinin family protein